MNKAQIYDYLYTESDKEKSMNSRLHNSPPLRFWRFLYVVVQNTGGL